MGYHLMYDGTQDVCCCSYSTLWTMHAENDQVRAESDGHFHDFFGFGPVLYSAPSARTTRVRRRRA